jgi:hypothetical protein
MPEDLSMAERFLQSLKGGGYIQSYEMSSTAAAVVKVKWPVSYLRIEVVQEKCKCGCVDSPDHGPCTKDNYEEGANGRCAHCDHAESCHPTVVKLRGEDFGKPL